MALSQIQAVPVNDRDTYTVVYDKDGKVIVVERTTRLFDRKAGDEIGSIPAPIVEIVMKANALRKGA